MSSAFKHAWVRALRGDAGIGLTELAVAIIVLGIIAVGIFPLVMNSIQLSVRNTEVAQANRIVATQLDAVRGAIGRSCTDVNTPAPTTDNIELTGSDASKFSVEMTVSCAKERLAKVVVSVERVTEPGKVIATATTNVMTP